MRRAQGVRRDHVVVKATVAGRDAMAARSALRPAGTATWRARIWFAELPARSGRTPLFDAGVILRVRAWRGGLAGARGDTTVILRPLRRSRLAEPWLAMTIAGSHIMTVGESWTVRGGPAAADDRVDVAALTRHLDGPTPDRDPLWGAWSALQRALVGEYSTVAVEFADLATRGPVEAEAWEMDLDGIAARAQSWTWPGAETLELSVPTSPRDAAFVGPLLLAALRRREWDPGALSQTKTALVLGHHY